MSRARPALPGFGALFCIGLAKALAAPPIDVAELLLPAMRAAAPPTFCPCCLFPVRAPSKDETGCWTWECFEGCNP
jgi:hypothetical protein